MNESTSELNSEITELGQERDAQILKYGYLRQTTSMRIALYAKLPVRQKLIVMVLSQSYSIPLDRLALLTGMSQAACLSVVHNLQAKNILSGTLEKIELNAENIRLLKEGE